MRTGTGRVWRQVASGVMVGAVAALTVACGEVSDGAGPAASDLTDAAGAGESALAEPACRPALGPDDPHPILDGGGGSHPDLAGIETTLDVLQQAVETDLSDVSGGLWLDQAEGEIVVMLTGDDRGAVLADLRERVDHPDLVVCMDATFTEAELMALQRTVHEAASGPSSTGIDTVLNRITASIETDADAVVAALEASLSDRELAAVDLEVPPCAEVEPIPDGGIALPGGGSTCDGMAALLSGTLVGDEQCAWVDAPEGEIGVAWPRGWWIDADGAVHDHHGVHLASIGDRVDLGGGFLPATSEEMCGPDADGVWLVASLDPAS
jgi:hypothetical protein